MTKRFVLWFPRSKGVATIDVIDRQRIVAVTAQGWTRLDMTRRMVASYLRNCRKNRRLCIIKRMAKD